MACPIQEEIKMANQITYKANQTRLANVLIKSKTKQGHEVKTETKEDGSMVVSWSDITITKADNVELYTVRKDGQEIATILCGLYGQSESVYSLIGYTTPISEPIIKAGTLDFVIAKAYKL